MIHILKKDHHQIARHIACESMVLLKNEDNILPLSKHSKIAIIGEYAKKPRCQGIGSSHVKPTRLDNAYDQIVHITGASNVKYAKGYDVNNHLSNSKLFEEAIEVARASDIALLFVGLPDSYESEGFDREDMALPESHNKLILEVRKVNKNIIIILFNGSPVEMPWVNQVKAIVESYLSGQGGGGYAVAKLLYGDINPCGKLAETFPLRLKDCPTYNNFF